MTMIHILLNSNLPIDTLKYLQNLNDNIDAVRRIVDVSNSTIANEISAVNIMLVAFTIVFGIVGVFLGFYISWLQRKISKMSENIEKKEQTIMSLAKAVEETDNKIQSDISGLYAKLRKEETMTLLYRLEEEPEDISNLVELLLARPLDIEGFPILKRAFIQLMTIDDEANTDVLFTPSKRKEYTLLFFQHFLYQSILDDELRPEVVKEFDGEVECAFKSDIIRSTKDLCKALSNHNVAFDKISLLKSYLIALNQSKYSVLEELRTIFQDNLDKGLLVEAIDQCTSDKVYLEMFGIEAPGDSDKGKDDDKEKK